MYYTLVVIIYNKNYHINNINNYTDSAWCIKEFNFQANLWYN